MASINITLNSIEKVKVFVNIITKYEGDFDLSGGRYVVDAKSIMGIFSLDLSKTLKLDVYDEKILNDLKKSLAEFII
ncbi:PTS sugar transporter [Candidatus Epulonipiscium fishelsonii]|uniref:PTS sugar transporter n=1 Tax=Candidatus Epulonipiscium fishelsonii TaxID=77094 RepID=A0ACC8XC88_9FIRM|nr:PTS sugar transporter [Epulopiscium sp. SCG-B11WGA-EpuloA1]ONI43563.1 PTS sugar transporter [Epulopiscium sp. SCG-B05WGA-EpuloA1]